MSRSKEPDKLSFDDVQEKLRSWSNKSAKERLLYLTIALTKIDMENWPSVPELALVLLDELRRTGLHSYDQWKVSLIKQNIALDKQLSTPDERERAGRRWFKPTHEKILEFKDELRKDGIHPVPKAVTGEPLTLVEGNLQSANWRERVPKIVGEPLQDSNLAILAALTVLEGGYLDTRGLQDEKLMAPLSDTIDTSRKWLTRHERHLAAIKEEAKVQGESCEEGGEDLPPQVFRHVLNKAAGHYTVSKYVLALVRYRRPEFDNLPPKTQLDLLEMVGNYMGKFQGAVRQLDAVLEYGEPGKDLRLSRKDPGSDVTCAIFSDVYGLSAKQIADRIELPASPTDEIKGGHDTTRKSIRRGREILEASLGKARWEQLKKELPGAENDPPDDGVLLYL